jgi:hypothetical protein
LRCRAGQLGVGPERFRWFLGNFVREDEHGLLVGVEPPVEPEALVPLVLAPQGDLERLSILFVEKRGDHFGCRALLERHELTQRSTAQLGRRVAERPCPRRGSQKLEPSARTHSRKHDPGLPARFGRAEAQNQVGKHAHGFSCRHATSSCIRRLFAREHSWACPAAAWWARNALLRAAAHSTPENTHVCLAFLMSAHYSKRSHQQRAIEFLAQESQVPVSEVAQLYEDARAKLEIGARIRSFIGIFAIRNVRKMLRQRSRGKPHAI